METCCQKSRKAEHSPLKEALTVSRVLAIPFRLLIRFYQYVISPMLGPRCRFEPSCSHYADQSLKRFGLIHGSILAIKRLGKCHPWHSGGYDPVPEQPATPKHSQSH